MASDVAVDARCQLALILCMASVYWAASCGVESGACELGIILIPFLKGFLSSPSLHLYLSYPLSVSQANEALPLHLPFSLFYTLFNVVRETCTRILRVLEMSLYEHFSHSML